MTNKQRGAWQWNPPKPQEFADETFHRPEDISSANECTGLMPLVPLDAGEAEAMSGLYAIHAAKPQGNVGKDNPNNDPSEIHFHRGQ